MIIPIRPCWARKGYCSPFRSLEKFGLGRQIGPIGAGEVISAVLLLVPLTSSLGTLLVSAFWGGAICIHMGHGEFYLVQSVLLLLTWLGAYLCLPAMFSSFQQPHADGRKRQVEPHGAPAACEVCASGA